MTPGRQRAFVAVALLPLAILAGRAAAHALGANPVEEITHVTGDWALRFLVASLAVTPARRWLGLAALAPYRRTLGLLAFLYATLHFATFLALDLGLDLSLLAEEIVERPYVTAGFAAFALLTPLALTSTRGWQRRLGRRWTMLHRAVYVAAIAACAHYWWLVKADWLLPAVYAGVTCALLAARYRPRARVSSGPAPASSGRSSAAPVPSRGPGPTLP